MKEYTIFKNTIGKIVRVKTGWSWPAFLFPAPWALSKKMWGLAIGVFVLWVLLFLLNAANSSVTPVDLEAESGRRSVEQIVSLITLAVHMFFGIKGNSWRKENLLWDKFEIINEEYKLDSNYDITKQLGLASVIAMPRGLFRKQTEGMGGWKRLLLAVSFAWILGVGVFAYRDLSYLQEQLSYQISYLGKPICQYVFSAAQPHSEITTLVDSAIAEEVANNPKQCMSGKSNYDNYNSYLSRHRGRLRSNYVQLGIIPIIALFFFAWCATWVNKGFKQKQQGTDHD